jgi:hypothetical protein
MRREWEEGIGRPHLASSIWESEETAMLGYCPVVTREVEEEYYEHANVIRESKIKAILESKKQKK